MKRNIINEQNINKKDTKKDIINNKIKQEEQTGKKESLKIWTQKTDNAN